MYVTREEFRGEGSMPMIAQATESAIPNDALDDLIERASRYFDLLCGVEPGYFEPAGVSATARTFYGDGTHYLKLDRYVDGSLNATISVPSGYTAPNYVARNGYLQITSEDGIPLVRSRYPWSEGWWSNLPITVTARWGFSATPADVKLAVIELAVNLWRETDPANVKLVNLEGQPLREKVPPRVAEISKRYRVQTGVLV